MYYGLYKIISNNLSYIVTSAGGQALPVFFK